ncbi:hypothetical protein [Actinomyces qiguomingii]|uniref:hypothetical protein n=1 Tax=Actinomyces qiguomingii TaxID=2057800 RepID=UPI000CA046CD|nr:hypothetical protein [Actinomyces qiguomingii]
MAQEPEPVDADLLADVTAALRRALTDSEAAAVPHLAVGAAALIRGFLGQEPPEDASGVVRYVTAQMISRALSRPGDVPVGLATMSVTTGPLATSQGFSVDSQGGGVWLTRQDQIMLRPWRRHMVSAPLVSERTP